MAESSPYGVVPPAGGWPEIDPQEEECEPMNEVTTKDGKVKLTCRQDPRYHAFRYELDEGRRISINLPAFETEVRLRQIGYGDEAAQMLSDARYEWTRRMAVTE